MQHYRNCQRQQHAHCREETARFLAAAFLGLLTCAHAYAQESVLAIEFDFSNPGARSVGLGGAFAGLADDATAAFANPAGLVQLLRPEVSVEGRHWSYSTPYTEGGRYEGQPTDLGLDTTPGLRTGRSTEDVSGLSFLSFVYPAGNWSFAVYRHQLAKFRARTETQGLFHLIGPDDARDIDRRWFTDLDVVSYGISGGLRVHDRLSLGSGQQRRGPSDRHVAGRQRPHGLLGADE